MEKKKSEQAERFSPKERNSLLRLIYVLAKIQYGDMSQPYSIAKNIIQDAAEKGIEAPLGDDQLASKIKEATNMYEKG